MAVLLAFAGPLTFYTGALGVVHAPTTADLARLAGWWTLYGITLAGLLLIGGYGVERASPRERWPRLGVELIAGCVVAAAANLPTAGRASILLELGLVDSSRTMALHGFVFALAIALLYFAYLRRSRSYHEATARLAAAQTAQRHARRRIVEARAQELQARIDPQLLFALLDALRELYRRDAARAERFLDGLIVFLRHALPRLRTAWPSLAREVELARAFVELQVLADRPAALKVSVAPSALHARFPPGILLPLLDTASMHDGRGCELVAECSERECRVALTLGAPPTPTACDRVRKLLDELYGRSASLIIAPRRDGAAIIVTIPDERA